MIKKYTYPLSLIIACVVLGVVSSLFINQYIAMKGRGELRGHHSQKHLPQVNNLQEWMTFDYLNRSLGIPNEYLKKELNITSTTYPKITLRKAASLSGQNIATFIQMTSKAIERYEPNQRPLQK